MFHTIILSTIIMGTIYLLCDLLFKCTKLPIFIGYAKNVDKQNEYFSVFYKDHHFIIQKSNTFDDDSSHLNNKIIEMPRYYECRKYKHIKTSKIFYVLCQFDNKIIYKQGNSNYLWLANSDKFHSISIEEFEYKYLGKTKILKLLK